jgi:hypothetical protein
LNAQRLAVPFKEAASIQATATIPWDEIVIVVWGLGVCGLLLNWLLRWRQLRVLVRSSPLLPLAAPVLVRSAPATFEPGLVGFLRPVLLLPQRLADKLSLEEVESVATRAEAELRQRIKNDVPSPETEAYARRMIDGVERGEPDYDDMGPVLAYANQLNLARIRALMLRLGKFESMAFDKVAANGWDVYEVTFAHARVEYNITPLAFSSDGKVTAAYFGQVP